METRLSHLMVFSLEYYEVGPFFYFLELPYLPPIKFKHTCDEENGIVNCVISIPTNINPETLEQVWHEWKDKHVVDEYIVKN